MHWNSSVRAARRATTSGSTSMPPCSLAALPPCWTAFLSRAICRNAGITRTSVRSASSRSVRRRSPSACWVRRRRTSSLLYRPWSRTQACAQESLTPTVGRTTGSSVSACTAASARVRKPRSGCSAKAARPGRGVASPGRRRPISPSPQRGAPARSTPELNSSLG